MIFASILTLATFAYAVLGVWRFWIDRSRSTARALSLALLGMALWSGSMLTSSATLTATGEFARNLAWLFYISTAIRTSDTAPLQRWTTSLGRLLAILALVSAAVPLLAASDIAGVGWRGPGIVLALALGLVFSVLAVVYVHNLYQATAEATSSGFRVILLTLGILWAYDINLYTVALLGYRVSVALAEGRSFVALLLFPAFAVAARRKEYWQIGLSRQAAFQSLSVVALGLYFVGMSAAAHTNVLLEGPFGAFFGVAIASILSIVAAVSILSSHARAWLKVMVTKHLFRHRYDYRTEWLRFSATIGDDADSPLNAEERVIKSIADVTQSPAGLLLVTNEQGGFDVAARWRWSAHEPSHQNGIVLDAATREAMEAGMVVTLDSAREDTGAVAHGVLGLSEAWVGVPLVRFTSLIGMVILARPRLDRPLDWEDFDLLKVVGRQAAVHVADGMNQLQLEEARRFEEFNRRFAFIIHDIKNVVSQLSLVASNAREHGANPRFQADMASALSSSVEKMTMLLARLSTDRTVTAGALADVDLAALLRGVVRDRAAQHPIALTSTGSLSVLADAEKLRLAIDHLVQNAIDASAPGEAIQLSWARVGERGVVAVTDHGAGMSTDFIRRDLFKPFVSTKGGGFGIGAAEAKALITSMGGTIGVSSVEGQGSQFTIELLLGATPGV